MKTELPDVDFRDLANSHIRKLTPYQPGKPIEELERELGITSAIKLASNENPLGPSPLAILAAQDHLLKSHFYPDGGCFELKKAIAQTFRVLPEQLTIGNGSENVLELIIKSYLTQQSEAIISQYAFLTIPLLIKSYDAELITIPAKNYGSDIKKMIAAVTLNTRIIFVVNPNNPTGTYTNLTELLLLLESIPPNVLVVLDEAYNEYIDLPDYPNSLELLAQYPNLIITRTFSKVYGLAALRLGYAISSPNIADILNRARLPFNVNSIAAHACAAALGDHEHVKRSVQLNKMGMQQLQDGLKKLKVDYIPSVGNFITIHVEKSGYEMYQLLLQQGVIVRPLTAYDLPNHIRVTIGTQEQNERFLNTFQQLI